MDLLYIAIIAALAIIVIRLQKHSSASSESAEKADEEPKAIVQDYKSVYQSKWLFTYSEKDMYYKLKEFAEKHNLTVLVKVRLYDLVEPREGQNKGARYKIQAKHVDFVLCNQKLVARYIIELDDQSHNRTDRKERDRFVDEVLTACGYKVLHLHAYGERALETFIGIITVPDGNVENTDKMP